MYLSYNIDTSIDYGGCSLTMWYILRKVRMGVYSVCASFKSMAKSGSTNEELKNYKTLLKEHRESQVLERSKAMHHRKKALQHPEQYMCLIIDGMDQKNTCLPHCTIN